MGNTSQTADKDNFVNTRFVNLGILENVFEGIEGAVEKVLAKFLKLGIGKRGVEIKCPHKVDFDRDLGSQREGSGYAVRRARGLDKISFLCLLWTKKLMRQLSKSSPPAPIENNIPFTGDLLVETVRDSSSRRFVDNSEKLETGDGFQ